MSTIEKLTEALAGAKGGAPVIVDAITLRTAVEELGGEKPVTRVAGNAWERGYARGKADAEAAARAGEKALTAKVRKVIEILAELEAHNGIRPLDGSEGVLWFDEAHEVASLLRDALQLGSVRVVCSCGDLHR